MEGGGEFFHTLGGIDAPGRQLKVLQSVDYLFSDSFKMNMVGHILSVFLTDITQVPDSLSHKFLIACFFIYLIATT